MSNLGHTSPGSLRPGLSALPFGRFRYVAARKISHGAELRDAKILPWGTPVSKGEGVEASAANRGISADLVLVGGQESQQTGAGWAWVRVYETLTKTWTKERADVIDYALNGLERRARTLVALPGTKVAAADYTVGTSTLAGSDPLLYLGELRVEDGDAVKRLSATYTEAGIIEATVEGHDSLDLLLVTFVSVGVRVVPTCLKSGSSITDDPTVAFQGGAPAQQWRARIGNVNGLRTYNTTVFMKSDGSAIATPAGENVVGSWQAWARYDRPGVVTLSAAGIEAAPGNGRYVKVLVEEILSTASAVPDNHKPYSVKSWAGVSVSYIPADGSAPVLISKGASGYLAASSHAAGESSFAGIDVESVAGVASSDPTPSAFAALNNQVIDSNNAPAFTTDAGVRWYRRRRVTVVGTFGAYLDA